MTEVSQGNETLLEPTAETLVPTTDTTPTEVEGNVNTPTPVPDFIRDASFGRVLLMEAGYTRRNLPLLRF